jgi:hypothetical protein
MSRQKVTTDMTETPLDESDPRHHTRKIKTKLDGLVAHLRDDVGRVDEPRAKVLFEVTAEVLIGLSKAFDDYEQRSESAFQ